jgi:hypothetical protein
MHEGTNLTRLANETNVTFNNGTNVLDPISGPIFVILNGSSFETVTKYIISIDQREDMKSVIRFDISCDHVRLIIVSSVFTCLDNHEKKTQSMGRNKVSRTARRASTALRKGSAKSPYSTVSLALFNSRSISCVKGGFGSDEATRRVKSSGPFFLTLFGYIRKGGDIAIASTGPPTEC